MAKELLEDITFENLANKQKSKIKSVCNFRSINEMNSDTLL